jgi:hypothetical protein
VIGLDTEQKFGIFYVAFFGTGLQTWILHFWKKIKKIGCKFGLWNRIFYLR